MTLLFQKDATVTLPFPSTISLNCLVTQMFTLRGCHDPSLMISPQIVLCSRYCKSCQYKPNNELYYTRNTIAFEYFNYKPSPSLKKFCWYVNGECANCNWVAVKRITSDSQVTMATSKQGNNVPFAALLRRDKRLFLLLGKYTEALKGLNSYKETG